MSDQKARQLRKEINCVTLVHGGQLNQFLVEIFQNFERVA